MSRIWIYIACFLITFPLFSQKQFDGPYTFNGIEGRAAFGVMEKEGEVLKTGDFSFWRKQINGEDRSQLFKTNISGQYLQGLKTGTWEFVDESHQVSLTDVVDFRVQADLLSQQSRLEANYRDGVPHGRWQFEENEFSKGTLRKKSLVEDFNFRNGSIRGRFQFKDFVGNKSRFFRGQTNDQGVMVGEWTLVYLEEERLVTEVRNYEDGFLLGLVKRDLISGEVLEEVVLFETIDKLRQVNQKSNKGFRVADQKFGLEFTDGFLSGSAPFLAQQAGNRFMADFLVKVLRYEEDYVNSSAELIRSPFHTKRFVFELSRSDQKLIEDMPAVFDKTKETIDTYANKNSLNLHRQKTEELAAAHAFFALQENKMKDMKNLIDLFKSKEIQYVDVQALWKSGLPFFVPQEFIAYKWGEEEKKLSLDYSAEVFEKNFFEGLKAYLDQISAYSDLQKQLIDEILARIEQDEELGLLQQEILDHYRRLTASLEDSEGRKVAAFPFKSVHENILLGQFNGLQDQFAKLDDYNLKKEKGRAILDLLKTWEAIYPRILELPDQWERIDLLYMEETFNPFTYSRYPQRVQVKLFEAGERLWEHYTKLLSEEKDYVQLDLWMKKIEKLSQRMEILSSKDTRRLEQKINRRLSVSKLESLLEL